MNSSLKRLDIVNDAAGKASSHVSIEILTTLQSYNNGLVVQWLRMMDDLEQMRGAVTEDGKVILDDHMAAQKQLEMDIHFFIICWDKVKKFMLKFQQEEDDRKIYQIHKGVKEILDEIPDARHFLEHLDEEIAAGKGRPRGWRFSGGSFYYNYTRTKKGKPVSGMATIGLKEILMVRKAFEDDVAVLRTRAKSPAL